MKDGSVMGPMPLATGRRYAEQIVTWLSPHCHRIEIAGSIRRERPMVGDVDIVCIPKVVEHRDLTETVVAVDNMLHQFLQDYVKDRNPINSPGRWPRWVSGGEKPGQQSVLILRNGMQLDLWFAEKKNIASRLLCRTGSMEHNVWLAERAQDRGYKWASYEGLIPAGQREAIPFDSEAAIYAHLGLGFIEPKNREREWIGKNLEFGLTQRA